MSYSDAMLFVECDGCNERVEFAFSQVAGNLDWKKSWMFEGWEIDWEGDCGYALCPTCKSKPDEEQS